jgi:hypothetical protein
MTGLIESEHFCRGALRREPVKVDVLKFLALGVEALQRIPSFFISCSLHLIAFDSL